MTITSTRQQRPKAAAPLFAGQSTQQPEPAPEAGAPDLVTAIFDVLIETNPELAEIREEGEAAVRARLCGLRGTVLAKPNSDALATRILSLFNGRNPREVARKLGVGRATVYRHLKQAGVAKVK